MWVLHRLSRNRTILELKPALVWAAFVLFRTRNRTILELKQTTSLLLHHWLPSRNRTILELKLIRVDDHHFWKLARNRTILELKLRRMWKNGRKLASQSHHFGIETEQMMIHCYLFTLAIAPFWNWNWSTKQSSADLYSRNRTILELKLCAVIFEYYLAFARNRTILELKHHRSILQ